MGDSPASAEPDEHDVVDAEILDDEAAQAVSAALTSLSHGIENKLSSTSLETLKGIAAAAGAILNAAQEELADQ